MVRRETLRIVNPIKTMKWDRHDFRGLAIHYVYLLNFWHKFCFVTTTTKPSLTSANRQRLIYETNKNNCRFHSLILTGRHTHTHTHTHTHIYIYTYIYIYTFYFIYYNHLFIYFIYFNSLYIYIYRYIILVDKHMIIYNYSTR